MAFENEIVSILADEANYRAGLHVFTRACLKTTKIRQTSFTHDTASEGRLCLVELISSRQEGYLNDGLAGPSYIELAISIFGSQNFLFDEANEEIRRILVAKRQELNYSVFAPSLETDSFSPTDDFKSFQTTRYNFVVA